MAYSQRSRTRRLFKELGVDERFRAFVEVLYEEGSQRKYFMRELFRDMPPEQVQELVRRADIYDGINIGLADHLKVTAQRLKTLRALFLVAETRRLWGSLASASRAYLAAFSPEPITRSALTRRRREAEPELVPLEELASWAGEDGYEARLEELNEAIASGALKAHGEGGQMLIAVGDYCRWAQEEIPIGPEFGFRFDVRPNSDREKVERQLGWRAALLQALAASPEGRSWEELETNLAGSRQLRGREEPLDDGAQQADAVAEEERCLSETIWHLMISVYRELRAIEDIIREANEVYLPDEDLAQPDVRRELSRQLDEVAHVYGGVLSVLTTPPFDLPEPGDEEFELMRHIMHASALGRSWDAHRKCSLCRGR